MTVATRQIVAENAEWLLEQHPTYHPEHLARRLGYGSPSSLYTMLRRAGRPDLVQRLHDNAERANPRPPVPVGWARGGAA